MRFLAYVLLLLGGVGWFSGFFDIPWATSQYEMPLGDLKGVTVDSSGDIYCGAQFYCRVQKYDPEGRFLLSLRIDASGGAFRIRVNQDDELEVATARNDQLYRFAPKGELLDRKENVGHFYSDFGAEGEKECRGPENAVYRIKSSLLFPSVVRISAGVDETVVSVPVRKWLVMGPFPAWLFWTAAILLLGGIRKLENKKGKPQPAGAAR
jgi:hypothetical protein